tara:strand:- start:572 stop:745 length:174 start_codon:yes stop_codon:yes gene_type:complete
MKERGFNHPHSRIYGRIFMLFPVRSTPTPHPYLPIGVIGVRGEVPLLIPGFISKLLI